MISGQGQFNQPALKITARLKKIAKQVQVNLFNVDSALLALLNMELPLAASPPMPSPFGLWRSTKTMSSKPLPIHVQDRIEVSIIQTVWGRRADSGDGSTSDMAAIKLFPVMALGCGRSRICKSVGAISARPPLSRSVIAFP